MNFNLKFCILANNFSKYFTKYSFCFFIYLFIYFDEVSVLLDGAKNHLNVRIKTKSVTAGADATEYVWLLFTSCYILCLHLAYKPYINQYLLQLHCKEGNSFSAIYTWNVERGHCDKRHKRHAIKPHKRHNATNVIMQQTS